MIGVYFFLLFAGYTIFLLFKAVEAGLDRFWRAMAFRQFQKKIQSQEIWLVCSATTSIWALGWTFVVLGFQDGVQVFTFLLCLTRNNLVMTIQGSSPVAATTMTTPNTPFLLRSLYFFTRVCSQYNCLSPTHSGVYLCISRVSYHCYKTRVHFSFSLSHYGLF